MDYLSMIYLRSLIKCEQLKSMDVIGHYDIEIKKQDERLCLDDGVTEFDVVMDIKLQPKKTIQYIEMPITITKSGTILGDDKALPESK
jgi:hypothetical protein